MSSKIDINLFWADTQPSRNLAGHSEKDILPRFGKIGIAAVAAALAASRPEASLQLAALPFPPAPPIGGRG